MSSEPLLKTFRAITSAEAVGQDHPEHMTVLRTFISAPARPGSGVSGMAGMERLADGQLNHRSCIARIKLGSATGNPEAEPMMESTPQ